MRLMNSVRMNKGEAVEKFWYATSVLLYLWGTKINIISISIIMQFFIIQGESILIKSRHLILTVTPWCKDLNLVRLILISKWFIKLFYMKLTSTFAFKCFTKSL
jgi:hypothetical protein